MDYMLHMYARTTRVLLHYQGAAVKILCKLFWQSLDGFMLMKIVDIKSIK